MTDTVVTPETVFQTVEIDEEKIAIVKEKSVQVVTVGTQGPSGSAAGYTGSINVQLGSYGGVLNMTVVKGLIMSMGIYGM